LNTRKVKQILSSQPEGVRIKGRPRSRWWECVWTDIMREESITGGKISRNRNEWRKVTKESKVHLGF
jgi:hypothetical protein